MDDDLLAEIMNQSALFFEGLVVDLMKATNYGDGFKSFADAQHIILVDGKKLTELMIEYGLGVSTQKTYSIKRIDSDYFADN